MAQLTIALLTSPDLSPSRRRPRRVSREGILLSENTQRRRKADGEPRVGAAAWDSADLVLNRRRPSFPELHGTGHIASGSVLEIQVPRMLLVARLASVRPVKMIYHASRFA